MDAPQFDLSLCLDDDLEAKCKCLLNGSALNVIVIEAALQKMVLDLHKLDTLFASMLLANLFLLWTVSASIHLACQKVIPMNLFTGIKIIASMAKTTIVIAQRDFAYNK